MRVHKLNQIFGTVPVGIFKGLAPPIKSGSKVEESLAMAGESPAFKSFLIANNKEGATSFCARKGGYRYSPEILVYA